MFTISVNGSYPKVPEPPRPSILMRARDDYAAGRISERELQRASERAVVEAVAEMVAAGVEVISDGQVSWEDDVVRHICRRLQGFECPEGGRPRAVERIAWKRPIATSEFRFIAERSPVDVRPVLTGPFTLARMCDPGVYGDDPAALTIDLARALNRELEGLETAGARYILIEEPLLAVLKGDVEGFAEAGSVLCQGLTTAVILATSGGDILGIENILQRLPFKGIALDMIEGPDNELLLEDPGRWEEFIVQLGLVSSRDARVESSEEIYEHLLRLSACRDPHFLWVGPTAGLGKLPRDCAFEKLVNMHRAVIAARRELARQELPG